MSASTTLSPTTLSDVVCTRCGCLCDDLNVRVAADRVIDFSPRCSLAEEWFGLYSRSQSGPAAMIHGHAVELNTALDYAADLLRKSISPLFFGLSRSSTGGQRAVCALADRLGATVDTTASIGHGPSIMAVQNVGESTSSLGEVRHRSDLILYWASDPMITHPRHMERFVDAPGQFVPEGRAGRHVVVVDCEETLTSSKADTFLRIDRGFDFEVLWALRLLVQGITPDDAVIGGIPVDQLKRLADRMRTAQYGAVFFGVTLAESSSGLHNVEALLRLVTDLNAHTRFVARRMRVPGDVTGADSVLCWRTGFPFSVSLNRGYPRFNPVEFSAGPMLERSEADCAVFIGAERVDRFSVTARQVLGKLPVIILDPPEAEWGVRADVRFFTATYGIHRSGTAYRMDEVPLPLRSVISSSLPSDEEILTALSGKLFPDLQPATG